MPVHCAVSTALDSALSFAVVSHMQEQVTASTVEKSKTLLPERQGIIIFAI